MLLGVAVGTAASKAGIYAELWSMKTKQDTEAKSDLDWPTKRKSNQISLVEDYSKKVITNSQKIRKLH